MDAYKERLLAINYELRDLQRKEDRLLFENPAWKKATGKYTASWRDKIQQKIPDKLEDTLKSAFVTAFRVVFQDGKTVLEKTFSEQALKNEYAEKRTEIHRADNRTVIQRLRKKAARRHLGELAVATTEGVGLGLLGIGLPDVPLLIANLIRVCTVSAKSHGIDPDWRDEQIYMLMLIQLAAAPQEARHTQNLQLDALADAIDSGQSAGVIISFEDALRSCAEQLSMTMLFSRFVMGMPIVGVAGGLYNTVIVSQLHQVAECKYEKRLLNRCKTSLVRQHHQTKREGE